MCVNSDGDLYEAFDRKGMAFWILLSYGFALEAGLRLQ
ncbi:hypothetical protein E6C60_3237 [Paenibacillus algicola]|uniref:Uncharacterized protein n=1 Tax=Paenibacillus algicola TaxID=2565926 RepID=A0A4P8XN11_9BACL|nr:hypothetical protein E6C60_3237 [Paenibacillus algicola]